MYNDTITLFNYYEPLDIWIPHVITNVNVNTDKAHIMKKYGSESGDNAELHIRYQTKDVVSYNRLYDSKGNAIADTNGNVIVYGADIVTAERIIADKIWSSPKEWLRNSEIEDSLTIQLGDFFIKDIWQGEIVKDSDYSDRRYEGFYAYMNAMYDDVYIVTAVNGPYKLIPHFEVIGK